MHTMHKRFFFDNSQTLAPRFLKPLGQYARTCCGCAATCPFLHVCVDFACASAHAKSTQTCLTTRGRLRRPTCTGLLPFSRVGLWMNGLPTVAHEPWSEEYSCTR